MSPILVSAYFFSGFPGTDIIVSTAFLVMKFLVVLSPRRGGSSLDVGTAGFFLSASAYSNFCSEKKEINLQSVGD